MDKTRIARNISLLKNELPRNVQLVAVSKFKSEANILQAYEAGQRDFGENYVQELVAKAESLPEDIRWHFIGHLQSNKVKYIAPFVNLIHSVDSLNLLKEINKQAAKHNRVIDCLLQVKIAEEETKTGMDEEELSQILIGKSELKSLRIIGLMGMGTFSDEESKTREEFKTLKRIFDAVKPSQNEEFREVSMGMSGDWRLAVEEGSTMVRIGSSIFGTRN